MAVDNQKDLLSGRFDQPSEENEKDIGVELPAEDHEAQGSPIGDGGNHVASEPFAGRGDYGGFTFASISAAGLMAGTESGFVAPMDLGPFLLGLQLDFGIFDFQPSIDR